MSLLLETEEVSTPEGQIKQLQQEFLAEHGSFYKAVFRPLQTSHPEEDIYRNRRYQVPLWPDGELELPIIRIKPERENPDTWFGIALLMMTYLDSPTKRALMDRVERRIREFQEKTGTSIDTFAGIAKLGYGIAEDLARRFDCQWAPIDTGWKNWFDERLTAVPKEGEASITSAALQKHASVDPLILDRFSGRRVLVVDDVRATETSAIMGVVAAQKAGGEVVGFASVLQEAAGRSRLVQETGIRPDHVLYIGEVPLFDEVGSGVWQARR